MSLAHGSHPSVLFSLSQQVPSLLQHGVDVLIERRQRLIDSLRLTNRLLPVFEDGSRNLFPLGHLRQRYHSLELVTKCLRVLVIRERRILPRGFPRRQISSELVELELHRRPRE